VFYKFVIHSQLNLYKIRNSFQPIEKMQPVERADAKKTFFRLGKKDSFFGTNTGKWGGGGSILVAIGK
jgi:hypothetical protein